MTIVETMLYVALGLVLGAVSIYAISSRRMYVEAEKKASQIASRLFQEQRFQLEESIRESYETQFGLWRAETVQAERQDALQKSRSILKGKIGEQIAPLLPEFLSRYNSSDARFLGSPVDYVIFKNLSEDHSPLEIVLVDIKTGNSSLSRNEKRIEDAIISGRVAFQTLRLGNLGMMTDRSVGEDSRRGEDYIPKP